MGLTAQALQRIRDAVGDDDEILADILQSFVVELDPLLLRLSVGARDQDMVALRQAAHTLKSSCRDLGDEALARLCADLEDSARKGSVDQPVQQAASIASRCLVLKSEVESFIATVQRRMEGRGV